MQTTSRSSHESTSSHKRLKHHRLNALENEMKSQPYEIGMVGLGVMGRNFLLNMADHGNPWPVTTRMRPK